MESSEGKGQACARRGGRWAERGAVAGHLWSGRCEREGCRGNCVRLRDGVVPGFEGRRRAGGGVAANAQPWICPRGRAWREGQGVSADIWKVADGIAGGCAG